MVPILRDVGTILPQVISGDGIPIERRHDVVIQSFGGSGIDILIGFWM
mgnify:CR=1 FL=1